MRVLILLTLISVFIKCISAGAWSTCEIEGLRSTDWLMGYTISSYIDDTHEGVVATFKTSKIIAMKVSETTYLNATFENEVLTIFTNDRFKDFEKEAKGSYSSRIEIGFYTDCEGGSSDVLKIYQRVNDVNNHDPILNQNHYEFDFAMTVPKDFDMTLFQTISAVDDDFTNSKISFSIEEPNKVSEALKIRATGKTIYGDNNNYFTSLTAMKNITAPFKQEFIIIATDEGDPTRSTKATVVVRVLSGDGPYESNEDSQEEPVNSVHPPVFSQHLYFGNYTLDDKTPILRTEPIVMKYAEDDLNIKQTGYAEYFQIKHTLKEQLSVIPIKPLPESLLEKNQLIIEIEAQNPGLSIPARTALIISWPKDANSGEDESSAHPPVFSQHLYFANYTYKHELIMDEPITIKHGATDNMAVKQSDYNEYFKITQDTSSINELRVEIIKPLSDEILEQKSIVIEIEAENQGLTIPARTALLIAISKEDNSEEDTGNSVHPPVFSKHLYFGNYTLDKSHLPDVHMEPIFVKYGEDDMVLRQFGYEEYFKVKRPLKEQLAVIPIRDLPDSLLQKDVLIIEIEAENPGLTISARTAVVIRPERNISIAAQCDSLEVWGFNYGSNVLPTIIFIVALVLIVFGNILVLSLYFRKQQAKHVNEPTRTVNP